MVRQQKGVKFGDQSKNRFICTFLPLILFLIIIRRMSLRYVMWPSTPDWGSRAFWLQFSTEDIYERSSRCGRYKNIVLQPSTAIGLPYSHRNPSSSRVRLCSQDHWCFCTDRDGRCGMSFRIRRASLDDRGDSIRRWRISLVLSKPIASRHRTTSLVKSVRFPQSGDSGFGEPTTAYSD